MNKNEAIQICNDWFAHNEKHRVRSVRMQELARMAREGKAEEAQRELRQIDRDITVFDGGRLEPAVRKLVELVSD